MQRATWGGPPGALVHRIAPSLHADPGPGAQTLRERVWEMYCSESEGSSLSQSGGIIGGVIRLRGEAGARRRRGGGAVPRSFSIRKVRELNARTQHRSSHPDFGRGSVWVWDSFLSTPLAVRPSKLRDAGGSLQHPGRSVQRSDRTICRIRAAQAIAFRQAQSAWVPPTLPLGLEAGGGWPRSEQGRTLGESVRCAASVQESSRTAQHP